MEKINNKKNNFTSQILSENDLNVLLYKLKNKYNLITTINQKRNLELEKLNSSLLAKQEKLNKIIDFQEIELPEEKISLKKIKNTKMTREELEKNLRDLDNEKRELDSKVYIANQYSKTLQYMFDEEKKKILNIHDETDQIQKKLNNLQRYHKLIIDNMNKTNLKNNNFNELNEKLQKDINLSNKIIKENNEKNEFLERKIIEKQKKIYKLKKKITSLKIQNKKEIEKYKEDIYEKIRKSKENVEEKNKTERKYIKIIYCLYILQKYFIEPKQLDYEKLSLNKFYKAFINDNYEIDYNNEEKINEENINNSKDKGENKILTLNNSSLKLKLDEIKNMFNDINIKREIIFDYISKLLSRIAFNKNCLNYYHSNELSLIDKKEEYLNKVKKIIDNNYSQFEEMSKYNSIFTTFLEENKDFINNSKNKNRQNNLKEIQNQLNINIIQNKKEFKKNSKLNYEQLLINSNKLYEKLRKILIFHNYFIDNINDSLKDIIISVENLNNHKNKDNESKENNLFEIDNIKSFKKNYEAINNFKKIINEKISNNSCYFIKYLKELIEYNKNKIKEKSDDNNYINNLLFLFFKEKLDNKENIDELFYNRFISNNIQNENKLFNFFNKYSDKTIDILRSLLSLINQNENNKDMIELFSNQNKELSLVAKKPLLSKNLSQKEILNNFKNNDSSKTSYISQDDNNNPIFKKIKIRKSISSSIIEKEKINDSNKELVEDKETSLESESIKNEEVLFKRKINLIEQKIIDKLYKPFFDKSNYLRKISSNMKNINNMSLNYSKLNFIMNKKRNEIDLARQQMLLYNNPRLDVDELSTPIYNNINKLMIEKRINNMKKNNEKRFRSTFNNGYHKLKI